MTINPAKILLEDYLELKSLTPKLESWDEGVLQGNPPRYYRLLRINACKRALGIDCLDFQEFSSGFWYKESSDDLVEKIEHLLHIPFQLQFDRYLKNRDNFSGRYTFLMLLQLREALYQLSSIRSTVLIASGHFATPVHMIDHLQKKIAAEQLALDEVLRLLLNPAKIQFDYGLMISSFGFPDVNLSDIDLEWM